MLCNARLSKCFPVFIAVLCLFGVLFGCGDDPTPLALVVEPGPSGHFVDAQVQGLSYAYGIKSGLTAADGKFTAEEGSDITFSVGGIALGTAPGAAVMSPITLVPGAIDVTNNTVTNIARFLQTIDDDANVGNGIKITALVRSAAAGKSIDFQQDPAAFGADANVQSVMAALTGVTAAGARPLIDAGTAQSNLTAGLRAQYEGGYEGDFCVNGGENGLVKGGTWDMNVDAQGNLSIGFNGTPSFVATGVMAINGEVNLSIPGGGTLFGSFNPGFSGNWSTGGYSGTFSEARSCRQQ